MKIGVLDILSFRPARGWMQSTVAKYIYRQYASIMPQAVSVWCRQLGHDTFYATYYGIGDAKTLLPDDLDAVFISAYTQASPLAYALAKLFRKDGVLTIIGGPHAKAFPDDCARFFDVVVLECNKSLVEDILTQKPRGVVLTAPRQFTDLPSVHERLPEIKASVFARGRPYLSTTVSLLSSVGCPYTCNFCIDWNNPFALLPLEKLEADLRFILENYPKVFVGFHDPNFAVRFDEVLDVLEKVPHANRAYYVIESSLSILKPSRLEKLASTGCMYVIPGVESWSAYSNKAGVGAKQPGHVKVEQVAAHFHQIRQYVPGMQANLIIGLDTDEGGAPFELTKEFLSRAPFVWPAVNIPVPFGGTPLHEQYLAEERILPSMPFAFYYSPYLVTTLKNYDVVDFYARLIDLNAFILSPAMKMKRFASTRGLPLRLLYLLQQQAVAKLQKDFKSIVTALKTDKTVSDFHEGRTTSLPRYYRRRLQEALGPYAELLTAEDLHPVLTSSPQPDTLVSPNGKQPLAPPSISVAQAMPAASSPSVRSSASRNTPGRPSS